MHDPAARLKKQNKRTLQELFSAQGFAAARGGDGLLRMPVSPCQGDRELDNEVTVKRNEPFPNPRERAFLSP